MNEVTVKEPSNSVTQNNDKLQQEINTLREQIMPGAKDSELALFGKFCEKTQLDPFSRQIYAISRKSKNAQGQWVEKWSYQTSIDGFRVVAQRSNAYQGQTPVYWCGSDGVWKDVWLSDSLPMAAKVGVYRDGHRDPIWGVAKFTSYAQSGKYGLSAMWKKMPEVMIAKCAESLALRKAFPNDLSGLYTKEEMDQSDFNNQPKEILHTEPPKQEALPPTELKISTEQLADLNILSEEAGRDEGFIRKCMGFYKREKVLDLSVAEYYTIKQKLIKEIKDNADHDREEAERHAHEEAMAQDHLDNKQPSTAADASFMIPGMEL